MTAAQEHSSVFDGLLRQTRPLAEAFHRAGHRLFFVGGIVRDGLRSRERAELDIDLTSDALPDEIEAIVRAQRPEAIWLQGKRFGTIGARIRGVDGVARAIEITTHRSELYDPASRKPEVAFSTEIVADLSRRDFTVNAMAVDAMSDPGAAVIIDPFSGLEDLRARRLRTPLGPEASFSDDPLRMLRAARFVAGHDLVADPALLAAIHDLRARLSIVSAERVRDEFSKLVVLPNPLRGLALLAETSLLEVFAPLFARLAHDDDVLGRVGGALADSPADLPIRLAVLAALVVDDPRVDLVAHDWAIGLRYPADLCSALRSLLALRASFPEGADLPAVRRFVRHAGALLESAVVVVGITDFDDARTEAFRRDIAHLQATEDLDMTPALDGASVMEHLGVPAGRVVGEALAMLSTIRLSEGRIGAGEERRRLTAWWDDRKSGAGSVPA